MTGIQNLGRLIPINTIIKTPVSVGNNVPFADVFKEALETTKIQQTIDRGNNELLASGNMDNLHKIMIDAEKADITLQFTMQIRNKIIEAYQEIMRMQL